MIRDMKDIGENVSNMKILPTDNNHTVDLSSLNEESFKTETREKHEALLNKLSSDQGMLENNYDYIQLQLLSSHFCIHKLSYKILLNQFLYLF